MPETDAAFTPASSLGVFPILGDGRNGGLLLDEGLPEIDPSGDVTGDLPRLLLLADLERPTPAAVGGENPPPFAGSLGLLSDFSSHDALP